MTITIIIDIIIMHCNINMRNLKQQYQFKHNSFTYTDYDDDCFNNKECDFKVKILVEM